jgi:hypothetical protein
MAGQDTKTIQKEERHPQEGRTILYSGVSWAEQRAGLGVNTSATLPHCGQLLCRFYGKCMNKNIGGIPFCFDCLQTQIIFLIIKRWPDSTDVFSSGSARSLSTDYLFLDQERKLSVLN